MLAKPQLQAVVAKALAEKPVDPILDVMLALAELPQLAARFRLSDVVGEIRADAAGAPALQPRHVAGVEARHQGLLYATRYLLRRLMDDVDPDSRAVDHFIHRSFLPQGRAEGVTEGHPEHVVPCAFIQRQARELLRYGIPVEEVASWVEPFVRVVWIEKAHAAMLDGKERLRDQMPSEWRTGRDCMYARLHHLQIRFIPPAEGPGCACRLLHP